MRGGDNTAITVADLDNTTLSSATVSITGGFVSAEDVLSFTNVPATMGNIAGVYNAGTGVMTLTSAGARRRSRSGRRRCARCSTRTARTTRRRRRARSASP